MYEVFGNPASRAFRVLWTLEELDEPYTLIHAKPRDPILKDVSPIGKIPVLRVDGHVITDSVAISTYLADKHGKFLAPAGTIERAKQDAMIHAILDELDAVLWTAARHSFALPEDKRLPEIKDSLRWEFQRNIDRIAERMTSDYAAGESFSVADILLTHCLNWSIGAKFAFDNAKISEYAERMRARPAFKRVRALG